MQELLLVNPAKRRKSRKAASPAQRRARAAFAAASRARRKNPSKRRASRRSVARPAARRRNPIMARARRSSRRRNPIAMRGVMNTGFDMLKNAAIGGAGGIATDYLFTQYVQPQLPASLLAPIPYAGVKAVATVALGIIGKKFAGSIALKAAEGALTKQAYDFIKGQLPVATQAQLGGMGRVGYLSPTAIMAGASSGKPSMISRGAPVRLNGVGALTNRSGAMGMVHSLTTASRQGAVRPR